MNQLVFLVTSTRVDFCSTSFHNLPSFGRRYKILAFDTDERVDVTMDNCRLLLLRLKLEGWKLGKRKVFLKYYTEEYLSRWVVFPPFFLFSFLFG